MIYCFFQFLGIPLSRMTVVELKLTYMLIPSHHQVWGIL